MSAFFFLLPPLCSLVLFERKLSAFLGFLPAFLKESVSTSLSAQILTSPILYFTFGYISLVSPLVNCLILWTVPLMTVLGIVAGFLSFLWPFLAKAILLLTYPLAFWLIETVKLSLFKMDKKWRLAFYFLALVLALVWLAVFPCPTIIFILLPAMLDKGMVF